MLENELMPFGKYKGQPITNLPDNYLAWLLKKVELREPLKGNLESLVWERAKDRLIQEFIDWHYIYKSGYSNSYGFDTFEGIDCSDLWDAMDGCLPNQ